MKKIVNPLITQCIIDNNNCLKFTFTGALSKDEASYAVKDWKVKMSNFGKQKVVLVWYCKEMTGYESMARSIWQNALKEMKNQIKSIWLISDSLIIKAGAKIMSMFASYDIKVVHSEDLIDIKYQGQKFSV